MEPEDALTGKVPRNHKTLEQTHPKFFLLNYDATVPGRLAQKLLEENYADKEGANTSLISLERNWTVLHSYHAEKEIGEVGVGWQLVLLLRPKLTSSNSWPRKWELDYYSLSPISGERHA